MTLEHRTAFDIEMTPEKLQVFLKAVEVAKENMMPGQTFRITVDHNVDFVFKNLKTFKSGTAISRESSTEEPIVLT